LFQVYSPGKRSSLKMPVFMGFSDFKACTMVYSFSFNGKEDDDETYGDGNAYDFGARIYDSRLGRWLSVDPLQANYQGFSPYNSSLNSPITLLDENGEWVKKTVKRYDENCQLIPPRKFWIKAKTIEITYTIHNAKYYNGSTETPSPDALKKAAQDVQKDIENKLTTTTNDRGQTIITGVIFEKPIEVINDLKNVISTGSKSDNLIYVADVDVVRKITKKEDAVAFNMLGENMMVLDVDEGRVRNVGKQNEGTPSHELLHGLGLDHSSDPKSLIHATSRSTTLQFQDAKGLQNSSLYNKGFKGTLNKVEKNEKKYKNGKL